MSQTRAWAGRAMLLGEAVAMDLPRVPWPTWTMLRFGNRFALLTLCGVLGVAVAMALVLLATLHRGQIVVWSIALAGALVFYVLLLSLVRQVRAREARELASRAYADQLARQTRELEQALRELRTRESRLEGLLEMSRQLCVIQPVESLLDRVTAACGHLLAADSAGIRLLEGEELAVKAFWGRGEATMTLPRLRLGESLSGFVALTGEPLLITDPANDPRLADAHRDAYRQLGIRGFLGMPVKIGDRVAGVLSLRTTREAGFGAEDVATARAFASQAAVALENARLYQESEERRRRLATWSRSPSA